mmetsp:Transcript_8595/g.33794  ORF Transcript_8595/g.33794 Transcript_8595/m.33794 type:complete len:209 (-) Transcript_8595:976-1602(-)
MRRGMLLCRGADGQVRRVLRVSILRPPQDGPVQHDDRRRHREAGAGARRQTSPSRGQGDERDGRAPGAFCNRPSRAPATSRARRAIRRSRLAQGQGRGADPAQEIPRHRPRPAPGRQRRRGEQNRTPVGNQEVRQGPTRSRQECREGRLRLRIRVRRVAVSPRRVARRVRPRSPPHPRPARPRLDRRLRRGRVPRRERGHSADGERAA